MFARMRAGIGLVLFAAALAPAACRHHDTEEGEKENAEPKKVRCAPIARQDIQDRVVLRGTVAPLPEKDALIAPQVAGRVLRVLVREGDKVSAGQELARIESANLQDQARQAGAQLAKARAETHLAETTEARVRRIVEHGIAARQELDDASARLATAKASEADAHAAAEIVRRQLGRASVRSPLAGVVLKVMRRPGELVDGTPATPVLEVGDPSHLELVATATAAQLVSVRPGAAASIQFQALNGYRFTGHLTAVSPAVDRVTGLGVVRIALDLKDVSPPVGIAGSASIATGATRSALTVPKEAVRAPAGREAEIILCGADDRARVERVVATNLDTFIEIAPLSVAGGESSEAAKAPVAWSKASVVIDPVLGVSDGDKIEKAQ